MTEFLEVPRNYLESFILGAEWNSAMSRKGRAWCSKQFVWKMGSYFITQVGE